MKITTDHSSSSYGIPVILDDDGNPMDYAQGVKAVRCRLGLSTSQLGEACGASRRTVEGWEQGRMPRTENLNVMADLLAKLGRSRIG